jgi:hypothetical protein
MRSRFGFLGLLPLLLLVLLVGAVAYNWGLSTGQTQVAPAGTVVYPVQYVHTFGFGFGGFLFFLLIIVLLLKAFSWRRWSGGHGGWGHRAWHGRGDDTDPRSGPWSHGDVPPMFAPMLENWHRRAHDGTATERPAGGPPAPDAPRSAGSAGWSGPAGSAGANDRPATGG